MMLSSQWPEAKMQDSDTLHLCQKLPLSVARVGSLPVTGLVR